MNKSRRRLMLTTKPYAFGGAVLTPKHARELTPLRVLTITAKLAEGSILHSNQRNGITMESTPSLSGSLSGGGSFSASGVGGGGVASSPSNDRKNFQMQQQQQLFRRMSWGSMSGAGASYPLENSQSVEDLEVNDMTLSVQYTVWITQAWNILKWAEPSAALFWEMATMFHTLHVADRGRIYNDEDSASQGDYIPPILTCGSTSSVGTSNTNPGGNSPNASYNNTNSNTNTNMNINKRKIATSVAKDLPVWLLGTFLLLHCEGQAFARNISAVDERRFDAISRKGASGEILKPLHSTSGKVADFSTLLSHPSLSPRTRIHAEQDTDISHCVFLLTHLRKFLLFAALPQNVEALFAIQKLISMGNDGNSFSQQSSSHITDANSSYVSHSPHHPDPLQIKIMHDREHSNVGHGVYLAPEDLERLSFILHPPNGGLIDDPPIKISDFFLLSDGEDHKQGEEFNVLHRIERKLRRYVEEELSSLADTSQSDQEVVTQALSKMGINNESKQDHVSNDEQNFATKSSYQKELTYKNLSQKSILLKPNSYDNNDAGSGIFSSVSNISSSSKPGRLHDLTIADCNDVHMYLLQPFENVTISACTGCNIVLGAVAGLLHVVDCERTTITSASRRAIVSNSFEVLNCIFTPSPPLLVGDNRSCQFAPYNTYYDGLKEDLLATGLAALVVDSKVNDSQLQNNSNFIRNVRCASNKWKHPIELAKLEIPQVDTHSSSVDATPSSGSNSNDSKSAMTGHTGTKQHSGDDAMPTLFLQPPSEFHILFVPIESEATRHRRQQQMRLEFSDKSTGEESQYCRNLTDLLQLSPFRLPYEYEKRVIVKAERMRSLQQAIKTDLSQEQKRIVEEEFNQGFRDWLVTSGNLRQVLDLVHMEENGVL